ncbi:MAG: dihydrolipoamide acetyltransferase family protein [Chitinophagales bacterium]
MAEIVRMPLMSDTMTEGVIAEWYKEIGDSVEANDLLAEIETDKATMEFEAPEDGILLFRAEKNAAIPVNDILAIIGEKGEDVDAILAEEKNAKKEENVKENKEVSLEQNMNEIPQAAINQGVVDVSASIPTFADGRLKASPLAKKMAADNNIEISKIKGSGDEGRIIKRDIEAYLANKTQVQESSVVETAKVSQSDDFEEVRVSQMRKTIARRLAESKYSAPHFYLTITLDMDKTMASRKAMNEFSPVKISFNDLIVKAAAMALRQHSAVNSSWMGDTIRINRNINIGVAVGVEEGLLVPVLRNADQKSLSELSSETKAFVEKAKSKKLTTADMSGNTFTISNLGMFGIDEFTAIINPPDACIMAVGGIKAVPAVVNGELAIANQMKVTLSCDHRVVDGVVGAKFLQTFKGLIEDPLRMLV